MSNPEYFADLIADDVRVDRFRQAIRLATVSVQPDSNQDLEEFHEPASAAELMKLTQFIQNQFPTLHKSELVQREVVNTYSILYTIRGSDSTLAPYLLASHLDVVPVDESKWDHPPFSAELVDGVIYGRGTLDMKATLFSILESLEHLLSKGFRPVRKIYLAFGHDEEIGGRQGACKIAELLRERDVQLEFVLDEGTMVISGAVPGLHPEQQVGMVAVSEKGFVTVELSTSMPGGHSSCPGPESSIGILAKAVSRLESNPQPCMFGYGPEVTMLKQAASKMSLLHKFVMYNLWLFGFIIKRILSRKPVTDAMQRTTTAITMFHAGVKSNLIAQDAVATVNHRVHPAQTIEQVVEHDRRVINDDRVKIFVKQTMKPGQIAPFAHDSFGFQTIRRSVMKVFSDAIVVPNLMIANTDSRYYESLCLGGVYKFMPLVGTMKLAELIHGNNERISVLNYEQCLNFYKNVILNADKGSLDE